jgi:6-phosphogluconolactonase
MTEIIVCRDAEELSRRAAASFAGAAERAAGLRGRFTVALSGGSTPRALYRLLATDAYLARDFWSRTHVFWGDERCVPPDHAESNYRMAREALLASARIPEENVHRMRGELEPAVAAEEYDRDLRASLPAPGGGAPAFDLLLLGMGDDAHTASLFPGTAALAEERRAVVANRVDKLDADRLTITPPVLRAAREVLLLVAGGSKAEPLRTVVEGPLDVSAYPCQLVRRAGGVVTWLVDEAAASLLSPGAVTRPARDR